MSRYDVNTILESTTLPIGGAAKRFKDTEQAMEMTSTIDGLIAQRSGISSYGINSTQQWPTIAFHNPHYNTSMHQNQNQNQNQSCLPYGRVWCKQEEDSTSDVHHQLQLGNVATATHNFFQQPSSNSVLCNNLMSIGSSSMEHSSGSNSVIYGNGDGNVYGNLNMNSNFIMPVGSTLMGNEGIFYNLNYS